MNIKRTFVALLLVISITTASFAQPPKLAKVIADLKSATASQRAEALRMLGKIDLGPAKPIVIGALKQKLSSSEGIEKAKIAHVLGIIGKGDVEVAKALIDSALSDDQQVRNASLKALMGLEVPRDVTLPIWMKTLQGNDHDAIMHVIQSMADLGKDVLPALRDALKHPEAAYWACLVASELGTDAAEVTPELIELLNHEKPEVQLQAIVALGQVQGDPEVVVPELTKVLSGDSPMSSKYAACFALGNSKSKTAVPALLKAHGSSDDVELKLLSGWAVLLLDPENANRSAALESVIAGLSSDSAHIRKLAVRALSDIRPSKEGPSPAVMKAMVKALHDSSPEVISQVIDALASKGAQSVKMVEIGLQNDGLRYHAVELARRLGAQAKPVVPKLINALQSSDDVALKREIHFALGAIGDKAEETVGVLKTALEGDESDLRYSACYALGCLGDAAKGASSELKKCLVCDDSFMRIAAVWSLLKIDPDNEALADKAIPLLTEALENDNEFIRAEAARALGSLGKDAAAAIEKLESLKNDASLEVRGAVRAALSEIK